MKIRCITNSIRLRVRKSDLQALITVGRIEEFLQFPDGQRFQFVLQQTTIDQPNCTYQDQTLQITLPSNMAKQWIASTKVGLDYAFDVADGNVLHVLIEKDFPCSHDEANYEDTFFELVEQSKC